MPIADDPRDCLMGLGVRPTCAAYIVFGMIQKAAKGDTSAAKFIKEINGEGSSLDENGITDLRSLSDVVLCRLAGFTLEKLMQSEA
jgi:hypothetical protein